MSASTLSDREILRLAVEGDGEERQQSVNKAFAKLEDVLAASEIQRGNRSSGEFVAFHKYAKNVATHLGIEVPPGLKGAINLRNAIIHPPRRIPSVREAVHACEALLVAKGRIIGTLRPEITSLEFGEEPNASRKLAESISELQSERNPAPPSAQTAVLSNSPLSTLPNAVWKHLHPGAQVLLALSRTAIQIGRGEDSVDFFQKALPSLMEAHLEYVAVDHLKLILAAPLDKRTRARAHHLLGEGYGSLGRNKDAIEQFKQSLLLLEMPDVQLRAKVHRHLASVFLLAGSPKEAIEELEIALNLYLEVGADEDIARVLWLSGAAIRDNGDVLGAIEQLERSLKLVSNDHQLRYDILRGLGLFLIQSLTLEKLDRTHRPWPLMRAVPYCREAIQLHDRVSVDKRKHAEDYLHLSTVLLATEWEDSTWQEAFQFAERAFELAKQLGLHQVEVHSVGLMGAWHDVRGDKPAATEYFERSERLRRKYRLPASPSRT